ncbi:MAG: IS256 family transposase [Candidatus Aminicenantes bacterium]|nr:IS256 family transposase [Candidatus Aminicenantes bacterium]
MDKLTGKADAGLMISESGSALDRLLREGARRLLQAALDNEVTEYLAKMRQRQTEDGRREVVRNGRLPERELVTGVGPVAIHQPRVRHRESEARFTSRILPPFMRRVPSVDALIPALYLRGISTGDFAEALEAILGPNASGLSATNIVRLKEGWKADYEAWAARDLSGKRYVYWWADGIYFNVRLDPERPCMLVIMGTLEDGTKELVAVWDGIRESTESWREVLRDLKARGLAEAPMLAVGDGALGFWAALAEECPGVRVQRCWVHKTANVLDKLPKSVQPYAKKLIHEMYLSPTKETALAAYVRFLSEYEAKYPKATDCLRKDEDVLFTFYDFPAEHWRHIRTTNPIESAFATVCHRHRQTKGCGSRLATLTMVFKLALEAERHWRKLNGSQILAVVIRGVRFVDGVMKKAA